VDWVQSFLQQLPTLVGVLIGAVATYAGTSVTERSRWRRAQSVRWDEKRVNAYAEYAHTLKQVITLSLRLAALRDAQPDDDSFPPLDGIAALDAAEEQRTMKWEAVLLLGSSEVVIAGRKWHQHVFSLERLAYGEPTEVSLREAVKEISQARRHFYEAAKRDIGVEIGDAPETYEWQLSKMIENADGLNWYKSGRQTND
jgi:hypothetical protein